MSSAYTRRHYVMVAKLVSSEKNKKAKARQALKFATMFKADNPRFDKERFLKACGYNVHVRKTKYGTHYKHTKDTSWGFSNQGFFSW